MLDLLEITAAKLKNGDFADVLPEYYALRAVVENSASHLQQNVLDHSIGVMAGWEKVMRLDWLSEHQRTQLQEHLSQTIGQARRGTLLKGAVLLHDISKPVTLSVDPRGKTSCPGHEAISSAMLPAFAERFGWEKRDTHFVQKIVLLHALPYEIVSHILRTRDKTVYFGYYRDIAGSAAIDLMLFIWADLLGSDMPRFNSSEFDERVSLSQQFIMQELQHQSIRPIMR